MIIKQIPVGSMENFAYLLGCEETKEGLVIDSGWEADKIIRIAKENDITIKYIVSTHFHYDHTNANEEMLKRTGAKLIAHVEDAPQLTPKPDITVTDNDTITFGNITITVIHTPGHSKGGICLLAENNLFTGDTLFIQGAGRTDLFGGNNETLLESLQKLKHLDKNIIVYPGHNYGPYEKATLDTVLDINPFL